MSRKQFAIVLLTVAVCSLLGGAITSRVLAPRPASAMFANTGVTESIEARQFVVIGEDDKTCAIIGKDGLCVFGPNNKTRVVVGQNGIRIVNPDNGASAMIGDSGLRVVSPNNKTRALVGENGLEVYDAKGKVRFKTP